MYQVLLFKSRRHLCKGSMAFSTACLMFFVSFIKCSLACRCAEATRKRGFKVFGLQNYGECWSAAAADKTYKRDGPSSNCLMILRNPPPPCDINDPQECAGKENVNYVYSLGGKRIT